MKGGRKSALSFEALSDSYAVREVNKTQFDYFLKYGQNKGVKEVNSRSVQGRNRAKKKLTVKVGRKKQEETLVAAVGFPHYGLTAHHSEKREDGGENEGR